MHLDLYHFLRGWSGWRLTPLDELAALPLALYPPRVERTEKMPQLGIFISGDGGWGRMGTSVARTLGRAGIPVVGLDSTRYFWKSRTGEEAAEDLHRIVTHFQATWGCGETILMGYSFGADVLPKIVSCLDDSQLSSLAVRKIVLISVGDRVELQFRFVGWIGHETPSDRGEAVAPMVRGLIERLFSVTAFRGSKETRGLETEREIADLRILPGGHFYGGRYHQLADEVLQVCRE